MMAIVETKQREIESTKLPKSIRLGNWGILVTIIGLVFGRAVITVADLFLPGIKGGGVPQGLWPVLILIWLPGIIGVLLSFYSIARYPYLSIATGGGQRIISTRSGVWVLLGSIFFIMAMLLMVAAFTVSDSKSELICLGYLSMVFFFAGFLMAMFRREKHITIMTFLELTFGVGIILFPFYIPSLMIGSIRCRRFLNAIKKDLQQG